MAEIFPRSSAGLIIGKFLPPHFGHQYLFDFARSCVSDLTILVCTLQREPIPGALRCEWVREMAPWARVAHVAEEIPQEPHEHPDFWEIWKRTVVRFVPNRIDLVFASEDYGWKLAEVLDATYVPVDHARELVPISGRALRDNPIAHWRYLPACSRPYFAKRVCLFGPESTGKTMLAKRLAAHYNTVCVVEYARPLLDFKNGVCEKEDIPRVARGQIASEDALARQAERVLFCDTDLLTTVIWSEILFGDCPEWIRQAAEARSYDLYLLTDIDVPFVADPQRYLPDGRAMLLERCRSELERRGRRYVAISGSWEERFVAARAAVDRLLGI